jgi:hypothetical protein
MSLWLAARVRKMSLAIASRYATQTAAVASERAGYIPLPVTATTPNVKTMIGTMLVWIKLQLVVFVLSSSITGIVRSIISIVMVH